jgi:hypothetical protein
MEPIGATYGVILNDLQLRQSLIRNAERSHRSLLRASGSGLLRRWFVHAFHGLAGRSLDLRPARTSTVQ